MCSGNHPTIGRIDLIKLLEAAFSEDFEKELMRKASLFFLRSGNPFVDHHSFDATNSFLFRDARVGDPI